VREAQVWWTDHRGDVWREPVLGGVGFRVFAVAELPGDRTLCNGGWGPRCYFPEHEFATTPDGQIAITRASGIGGVWIKNLGATPRRVNDPAERGAAHGPAWSLDGRRLAYWFDYFDQAMTELRVVNRDGTGSRVLLRMPYDTTYPPCGPPCIMDWGSKRLGPNAVVWHADGQRLLMATSEGTQQVPISGAAPSMYLAGFHPGPWFPNGQTQFVIDLERAPTGNPLVSDYRVFRADAAGIVRRASEFQTSLPPIAISPDGLLMADQDSVYPLNRRDGFEVTGSDHLLGFAR
jgi:hypothetical protein